MKDMTTEEKRRNLEAYLTGQFTAAYREVYTMKKAIEKETDSNRVNYFKDRLTLNDRYLSQAQKILTAAGYDDMLPELRAEAINQAKALYKI